MSERQVDVLVANAGHGLGHAFLDQSPKEWQHVINTNITGTLLLVQPIVQRMVERGEGKVLITGSIAGHLAGSFQAVYNGSKAFIDSFSAALNEDSATPASRSLASSPARRKPSSSIAQSLDDTKVGQAEKDDPADVAKSGWDAMKKGRPSVIYGLKNKVQVAAAGMMTDATTAKVHRAQTEPGERCRLIVADREFMSDFNRFPPAEQTLVPSLLLDRSATSGLVVLASYFIAQVKPPVRSCRKIGLKLSQRGKRCPVTYFNVRALELQYAVLPKTLKNAVCVNVGHSDSVCELLLRHWKLEPRPRAQSRRFQSLDPFRKRGGPREPPRSCARGCRPISRVWLPEPSRLARMR